MGQNSEANSLVAPAHWLIEVAFLHEYSFGACVLNTQPGAKSWCRLGAPILAATYHAPVLIHQFVTLSLCEGLTLHTDSAALIWAYVSVNIANKKSRKRRIYLFIYLL